MGYRLNAYLKSNRRANVEFGKHYGYIKDVNKLKSYLYLKKLGKFYKYSDFLDENNDVIYWDYGFDYQIILTPEQFEIFSNYYIEESSDFLNKLELKRQVKQLLDFKEDIIIQWG